MKYFAVLCLILNTLLVHGKMTNHVKAYKVECRFSEKYIANGTCSLKPVNRRSAAFNAYGYLIQPIDSIIVDIQVFRRYNTFTPFPISLKFDVCDYLSGRKKSFIFNLAKIFLDRFTNVNHTCPYSGDVIVKNFEFIPETIRNLTTVIPQGIYRMDVNAYKRTENNSIAFGRAYFEVTELEDDKI